MRMVFFGAGPYVDPIIKYLKSNYDLCLVVTTERDQSDPVIKFCHDNSLNLLSAATLKDKNIQEKIAGYQAQAAVLAYFGLIIPQSVIDIFPEGIINIHPSLLPKYRGSTPGQAAILNGDKETGVSIMLLDKEMDHGPILAQETDILNDNDTADTFYKRIFIKGTKLLGTVLDDYLNDKLTPTPQDHTKATFTKMLSRQDGFVDSEKDIDKEKFYRMVRAYYPWPGTWTKARIKDQELRIKFLPLTSEISHPVIPASEQESRTGSRIKSGMTRINNKQIDSFLLQAEGKKPVNIKDFLNGYPEAKEWLSKFII